MHIKRRAIPVFWPISRTGSKYNAVPSHDSERAVPLVVFMRDVLGLVKNKKELKKILNEKKVFVNGRVIKEENFPLIFFDNLGLPAMKKYYRVWMNGKRYKLIEVSEQESHTRVYKIIGKRKISNEKIQINLDNGKNLISSVKMKVGDFVILDDLSNKIVRTVSLNKGDNVIALQGKHAGKEGKIKEIVQEGEEKIALIKSQAGEIKANIKNLYFFE